MGRGLECSTRFYNTQNGMEYIHSHQLAACLASLQIGGHQPGLLDTVQYSAVQYSAVQCNAV